MRPLELTVEGFRSYRGPVTFDWRGRRLVGIVGPIGSGKSSVLDAVAFALYGKTPGVGSATKSLIHQLCDEAHVALTFQVDGDVWKAVRAPKRRGQSGHQLMRLASDDPEAELVETVTQEAQVNARVEQLLGMDFQTFSRSVLLAQNRFSDFLKATRTERDRVLKGVFGYERLDAAKAAADRRLDREVIVLESLVRERSTIDQARGRLDDARSRAASAALDVRAFDNAAPEMSQVVRDPPRRGDGSRTGRGAPRPAGADRGVAAGGGRRRRVARHGRRGPRRRRARRSGAGGGTGHPRSPRCRARLCPRAPRRSGTAAVVRTARGAPRSSGERGRASRAGTRGRTSGIGRMHPDARGPAGDIGGSGCRGGRCRRTAAGDNGRDERGSCRARRGAARRHGARAAGGAHARLAVPGVRAAGHDACRRLARRLEAVTSARLPTGTAEAREAEARVERERLAAALGAAEAR